MLSQLDQKVVVTDYGLTHWLAQTHNLNVNHLPKYRPLHMETAVFDYYKNGIFKEYMWCEDYDQGTKSDTTGQKVQKVGGNKYTVPEHIVSTKFQKMFDKEQLLKLDQKELAALRMKQKHKADPKDISWQQDPLRLQPVVYQLSKRLTRFSEFDQKTLDQ